MNVLRRPRPAPHIPFISLADIAWQIIIFFLVASTFLKSDALTLVMPSSSPVPAESLAQTILLEASETSLAVNGVAVSLDDLEDYVSDLLIGLTSEEQRAVIIRFRGDVSFQRNADILYSVQRAGGVVLISEERIDDENPPQAR